MPNSKKLISKAGSESIRPNFEKNIQLDEHI